VEHNVGLVWNFVWGVKRLCITLNQDSGCNVLYATIVDICTPLTLSDLPIYNRHDTAGYPCTKVAKKLEFFHMNLAGARFMLEKSGIETGNPTLDSDLEL